MDPDQREVKLRELRALQEDADRLVAELAGAERFRGEGDFYAAYYATTGFLLGIFGAMTSLLVNVIGSSLFRPDQVVMQELFKQSDDVVRPLWLIQLYLTFPLGEQAIRPDFDNGLALALGCCLYLATGMLLGIPFQLVFARFAGDSSLTTRLVLGAILGLTVWVVIFYGILSWLQPALFGGRWIVDLTPWYVAAGTHIAYGLTMALVYPLGVFETYRPLNAS
jgi:hypothetical protein